MSYRELTYVVFDGDKDMWAYAYMLGWISKDHMDFHFEDAHDLSPIVRSMDEAYIKRRLRERMSRAKQVIVLVGESTRYLYKYVKWELELAVEMGIPIVAVNLNNKNDIDYDRCPPVISNKFVLHVPFKMKAIQHALDNFPGEYRGRRSDFGPRHYTNEYYRRIGIIL